MTTGVAPGEYRSRSWWLLVTRYPTQFGFIRACDQVAPGDLGDLRKCTPIRGQSKSDTGPGDHGDLRISVESHRIRFL